MMRPPESKTVSGLLDELASTRPDDTALIDDHGERRTFEQLRERADAVAAGLADLGIGDGDRVGILMENRVEWVEAMYGVTRTGASVVGLSTWAKSRELAYYLSHSDAKAVIATATFAGNEYTEMLDDILDYRTSGADPLDNPEYPALERVILHGAESRGATTFDSLLESGGDLPTVENDPDDEAVLLYTSGSTSKPKGVPLLHGGVVENSYEIGERLHLSPDDRAWLASPLFWSYGSANCLHALFTHRGSVVLQSPFDGERAVELIDEHDCSVYYGMPNMARALVDAPGFDADRVRFETGTTIGSAEDVEFTIDELGVTELCNVYGLTEGYGNTAVTDRELDREIRITTQGEPLPGQEVVIKDPDTGDRLGAREVGEICIGGRITPGYHDAPEKNEAAFDDEGYLHTGDLGQLDEAGRLQYRGRIKHMIKTGGINVSPVEVQEYLLEYPGVDQAYVIGLDDPEKDEVVAAVVVPVPDATVTEADLREHCGDLAAYKRPARYAFATRDELPETDTGKVKSTNLAALF